MWLSPSPEPTNEIQAPLNSDARATPLSSLSSAASGTLRPRSGLEQNASGADPARDNIFFIHAPAA